jgi:hypothetical protein
MALATIRRTMTALLKIGLGVCLLNSCDQAAALGQAHLYPEPQQMEVLRTKFQLDDQALIALPRQASRNDLFLASLLRAELADRYGLAIKTRRLAALPEGKRAILMGSLNNPLVKDYCSRHRLEVTDSQPGPEGYVLQVSENLVLIAGSDEAGAFYGLQSLRQLVDKQSGGPQVLGVRIRDWPYKPFRGIRLYLPGHQNIPFFKRFVRNFVALYKYNKLIVEMNAGMRLDRHPELNAGWEEFARNLRDTRRDRPEGPHRQYQDSSHYDTADGEVLEKEEIAALVRWAREHFIEVIPELPSLTHSYYLLTRHRELAEIPEAEWPDTYCPSNPGSYKLLFDVLDEYIEVIKPRMVHIGHDEWRMPWGVCPRCRNKDPRELFAGDVRKIHDYLAEKGIRTAMWGDHLLEAVTGEHLRPRVSPSGYHYNIPGGLSAAQVEALIPKDILVFNWFWNEAKNRPSDPGHYGEPDDLRLQELGFQQVYGNFTPEIQNYGKRSSRSSVLGGAPSAWEATTEFNFGKDLLDDFVGCAGLLWSKHWVDREQLPELVQSMMPALRRNLRGKDLPSDLGAPVVPLQIASYFTPGPPPNVLNLDPKGLKAGRLEFGNLVFDLPDPRSRDGEFGVIATTGNDRGRGAPGIPVGEDVSSMIFLQASARPAGSVPGYTSIFNFPDTADLLGWYEVVYEDGYVSTVPIRYGVNLREWDWQKNRGGRGEVYWADAVNVGDLPDAPIIFFAYEWVNPRLGKVVKEVRLCASSGFKNRDGKVLSENAVILRALSLVKNGNRLPQ